MFICYNLHHWLWVLLPSHQLLVWSLASPYWHSCHLLHENQLPPVPGSCCSDVHQRIRTILSTVSRWVVPSIPTQPATQSLWTTTLACSSVSCHLPLYPGESCRPSPHNQRFSHFGQQLWPVVLPVVIYHWSGVLILDSVNISQGKPMFITSSELKSEEIKQSTSTP